MSGAAAGPSFTMRPPTARLGTHLILLAHLLTQLPARGHQEPAAEPKCGAHWLHPGARPGRSSRRFALDGDRSHSGLFPFLVRLDIYYSFSYPNGTKHRSRLTRNGVIVGRSHVVTVQPDVSRAPCSNAHKDFKVLRILVSRVGTVKRPGLSYPAKCWYNNPNFNCTTSNIGLVEIVGAFRFKVSARGGVNRVCVPHESRTYASDDYQNAHFVSFGWTDEQHESDYLRYMNTSFVDAPECQRRLSRTPDVTVPSDVVCLGTGQLHSAPDRRICLGDQGGALVRNFEGANWELVGIMSHPLRGKLCESKLIAFTKILAHLSWLARYVPDLKTLRS